MIAILVKRLMSDLMQLKMDEGEDGANFASFFAPEIGRGSACSVL